MRSPNRWSRTLFRIGLASVLCASSGGGAFAQGSACDPFPAGSTTFLARNRAAFQASGGQVSSNPEFGTFVVDALDKALSMRFTCPESKTIGSIWIDALEVKGPTGTIRVSLQADQDGQPSGLPLTAAMIAPQAAWQEVSVPPVTLNACEVYHVVVEPWTAPFDGTHFVTYMGMVTRSPLPWQPFDNASSGADSFFDPELALLFDDGSGDFVWQWDTVHIMYAPIFVLQATDLTTIGQPFDVHLEQLVVMDEQRGQSFVLPGTGTVSVNYLAFFTERYRDGMSQTDHRLVYIYDPVTGTPVTGEEPLNGSGFTRAHWFGATFPQGVTLNRGQEYYAVMRSDNAGSTVLGHWLSMERTTVPLGLGVQDPTYGTILRGAVYSADGGQTFNKPLGGRTDAGFMLANLAEPNGPLAVHDESAIYRVGTQDPIHVIAPNTPIDIDVVVRNIGGGQGDLKVDIIDPFTLQTYLNGGPRTIAGVVPNKDADGVTMTVTTPASTGLWRIDIYLGHVDSTSETIVDDVVRFEVLVQ